MENINKIIIELFKSVDKYFLFRQYFFVIILYIYVMKCNLINNMGSNLFPFILYNTINAILYPFAKLTFKGICSFIFGNKMIVLPFPIMIIFNLIISLFIYLFTLIIAPLSIGYILIRNRYTKINK